MSRTLRGAWSRRGTLLPLLLLTAVVVAGVVAVDALADAAGTSAAVAVPLLVLGLVAVPVTGRRLAAVRRGEIAVARLRGITGGQLYAVCALEPLLVLLAGAAAGLGAGAVVAWLAGQLLLEGASATVGLTAVPWVAGIVAVGLGAVLAGMAAGLREPLADQVSLAERPRPASTLALFWSVLLLAAAGVAVYRSSVAETRDADWVVLAGPALVGLAVGQVAVWLVRLAAAAAVGWTAVASLPNFLAARRLARVAEAATSIRLVVAAAVVAAVSLTGAQQVDDWAGDTARLRAGAPQQVPVDDDVYAALALTRDLDPDGRWLMAAALVPGEGSVPARRAFLDTARYDAVVGDFLDGTAAAGVSALVAGLASAEGAQVATGDNVRVTVRGVSRRVGGVLRPRVTLTYGNERGETAEVTLPLALAADGRAVTGSAPVPDCAGGCVVEGLALGRSAGDAPLPYVVTGLDFAGVDVLASSWRATSAGQFGGPGGPVTVDDGLMVLAAPRTQTAEPGASGPRTPVLATASASWPEGEQPLLDSPGGDERPAAVVGRLPALPLVGADGLLADLPLAAAGAPPTVPAAEVMVLAAADTPAGVLADLTAATGGALRTLGDVEAATDREVGAAGARVYALVAGFCLVVALLVLVASVSGERQAHRREVAALRLVGVEPSLLRHSGRVELAALACVALGAATAGGIAAVRLLLSHLSLDTVPDHTLPLLVGLDALPVAVAAVAAAAMVALVGGRARAVSPDHGRPATLREEVSA
jgi:hypothetical protein